ncbi:glycosyltransferase family 4 protein [Diplocloster modestus]|uniref:Glycosyltransferase family 4 protein n=1 Tax=Diplocloster modestus TaxID=2850322 RepID=A0ABS6K3R1_9FIRM|nr:glycosyltransferase family 4 protein [Diplocloster modestus]MBU9725169.1 glycosyltransferase family 4 protein [Diplocloster modestus]
MGRKGFKNNKPHLLIYAHYYFPDVASTGQILKELAEGMSDKFHITVICVVPSYRGIIEHKYKNQKYYYEMINDVEIIRVRVPAFNKEQKLSRIKNISVYFLHALCATFKVKHVDYVYSISQPPILGGLIGVWGKWVKHAKFIYNIQDFNPEQIIATGYSKNKSVLKIMSVLDNFSCKQADKIIVVGRDMICTLENRFHGSQLPAHVFVNNWIDEQTIYPLPGDHERVLAFKKKYGLQDKFVFMYSGNIGLYYDLLNLLKVIKQFKKEKNIIFAFVGEGSVLNELKRYKKEEQISNVVFIPYQDKENLIYSLNAGDVHWVVNAKGIRGISVPSKCYGVMGVGKAIIGVLEQNSEADLLINQANCGRVCEPGDYDEIQKQIRWFIEHKDSQILLDMGWNGRKYLEEYLTKEISIGKYKEEILEL